MHKFVVLSWVQTNISMDTLGTKRNGKFSNGENLDIVVGRFLKSMAVLNDGLHNWVCTKLFFKVRICGYVFRPCKALTTKLTVVTLNS